MKLADELRSMVNMDINEVFKNLVDICASHMREKVRENKKRNILVEIKEVDSIVHHILVEGLSTSTDLNNKCINASTIATMFDKWLRDEGFDNYEWTKNMFKIYW